MMEVVVDFLQKIVAAGFFGKIVLHFEKGRVVRIVKEESIKL